MHTEPCIYVYVYAPGGEEEEWGGAPRACLEDEAHDLRLRDVMEAELLFLCVELWFGLVWLGFWVEGW